MSFAALLHTQSTRLRSQTLCLRRTFGLCRAHRLEKRTDFELQPRFRVLFFGRDAFSAGVFRELFEARDVWESIDIATTPDPRTYKPADQRSPSELSAVAASLGVPVHLVPRNKDEWRRWDPPAPFSKFSPSASAEATAPPENHLAITASFAFILPRHLLAHFLPHRAINVHPSLLPRWRGPAPIQRAIMSGDNKCGVGIIRMAELGRGKGVDEGEVWGTETYHLPASARFESLRDDLAEKGGQLLVNVLRDMLRGSAVSAPQPVLANGVPPYAHRITAKDDAPDFSNASAEYVERLWRAIGHQRTVKAYLPNHKSLALLDPAVITPSYSRPSTAVPDLPAGTMYFHSAGDTPPALHIVCANGSVLRVTRVQQATKRAMGAHEWWAGAQAFLVDPSELPRQPSAQEHFAKSRSQGVIKLASPVT